MYRLRHRLGLERKVAPNNHHHLQSLQADRKLPVSLPRCSRVAVNRRGPPVWEHHPARKRHFPTQPRRGRAILP